MGMQTTMQWEVQSGGDDSNGGGFDDTYGTPGTDYTYGGSQAVITYTDLVINSTSNTRITSSAIPFTSAHVGNVINITGGTGFTVQRVQILSVSSNLATCDKTVGTISSTGGTGKLGGALASPGGLGAVLAAVGVVRNRAWIKSGTTYTVTSSSVNVSNGVFSTSVGILLNDHAIFSGYTTTRGDNGQATVDIKALTGIKMFDINGSTSNPQFIRNIIVEDDLGAGNYGFFFEAPTYAAAVNCVASSVESGFYAGRQIRCKAISCTIGFNRCYSAISCFAKDCTLGFDNSEAYATAINCIAVGGTNGFRDIIYGVLKNCLAYNCTNNGFDRVNTYPGNYINCFAAGCGNYGIDSLATDLVVNCGGWKNTSGNINTTPYVYEDFLDVLGTDVSEIFIDAPNDDFRLTDTASRGALLRAAGLGVYGQTNNTDIGAVQHADPSSTTQYLPINRSNSLIGR